MLKTTKLFPNFLKMSVKKATKGHQTVRTSMIHIFPQAPSMSSRFCQSLSHGSVSRYLTVLSVVITREMTSERARLIRVRGRGRCGCEGEVDAGERLGLIRVRGGGRYRCKMEVMTGERRWWIWVRDGGGCRCVFRVEVEGVKMNN